MALHVARLAVAFEAYLPAVADGTALVILAASLVACLAIAAIAPWGPR